MDNYFIQYWVQDREGVEPKRKSIFVEAIDLVDAFIVATTKIKEEERFFYINCVCKREPTDEYLFD